MAFRALSLFVSPSSNSAFRKDEVGGYIYDDFSVTLDRHESTLFGVIDPGFEWMVTGQLRRGMFDQFDMCLLRNHFSENVVRQPALVMDANF
jgi:hypothetical protein